MSELYMTEGEICASFRQAKDQKKQIGILADLNACTGKKIMENGGSAEDISRYEEKKRPLSRKRKEEANERKKVDIGRSGVYAGEEKGGSSSRGDCR